jgi:hypothetical protein
MFRNRPRRTLFLCVLASLAVFVSLAPISLRAQDDGAQPPEKHGRKYKAPPETSHIEVTVLKDFNKKPIDGAHVILHPVKDGKDEGSLEIKTHPDGKAVIDVIPTGSKVTIQVFADGFATFAQDYQIDQPSRQIVISVLRPRAQVSTYVDNRGKPAQMKPGVQEPVRPKPATGAGSSSGSSATPNPSSSGSQPQQ